MIKIILDPQIFNDQKFGGISKYYAEIYKNLQGNSEVEMILPLTYTDNFHIKESAATPFMSKYSFFIRNNIFRRKFIRKLKRENRTVVDKVLQKEPYDLFIPTYYDPYFLDKIGDKPYVLTVYDMIHELFPHYFGAEDKNSERKSLLIQRATKIIAVSNNTKKDILKFFPNIDPDKITVIYHGYSHDAKNDVPVIALPEKYILFVGNRENYKNFTFFLESIKDLLLEDPELYLVCAGGNGFRDKEKVHISSLGLTKKVIQQNFSDNELNAYYQNALCFVFPSIYEGFGIPIMEAMINNCPIILTDNSCFPEVGQEAVLYYELDNKADLAAKVRSFVYDPELREKYSRLGLERVQSFTWEKAAKECLEVYKSAVAAAQ